MNTRYGFGKALDLKFDAALERVAQELQKEGFGVLTEIDVAATMKADRVSLSAGRDPAPGQPRRACPTVRAEAHRGARASGRAGWHSETRPSTRCDPDAQASPQALEMPKTAQRGVPIPAARSAASFGPRPAQHSASLPSATMAGTLATP